MKVLRCVPMRFYSCHDMKENQAVQNITVQFKTELFYNHSSRLFHTIKKNSNTVSTVKKQHEILLKHIYKPSPTESIRVFYKITRFLLIFLKGPTNLAIVGSFLGSHVNLIKYF